MKKEAWLFYWYVRTSCKAAIARLKYGRIVALLSYKDFKEMVERHGTM
jgi:hypothetical protein